MKVNERPGYIPIFRKFFDHYLWDEKREFSKAEAWIDCIQMARYKEGNNKKLIAGKLIEWGYGQFPASIRFLKERWGWGSNTKVNNFLNLLEKDEMIKIEKEQGQNIITLCNYSKYDIKVEGEKDSEKTEKGQEKDGGKTEGRQNSKKGKKGKKGKNTPSSKKFDEGGEPFKLSKYLMEKVIAYQPTHQFNHSPPDLQKWALEADRMHRLHNRPYKEAAKIIHWLFHKYEPDDDFDWRDNVQSIKKLRKHYDKLKKKKERHKTAKLLTYDQMLAKMDNHNGLSTDDFEPVQQPGDKKPLWRIKE